MRVYKGGHVYYPEIPFFGILEDTIERFPDKHAFLYPEKITFKEFGESVDRIATALADIGVKKGDRVMLFSPNCIEWEIACFGISKAGGVFVPMNPMFREGEVEYQVTDAQAETMIVHESVYPVVKSIEPQEQNIFSFPFRYLSFRRFSWGSNLQKLRVIRGVKSVSKHIKT